MKLKKALLYALIIVLVIILIWVIIVSYLTIILGYDFFDVLQKSLDASLNPNEVLNYLNQSNTTPDNVVNYLNETGA
ncbi:MAG: hypothetical protein FWH54_03145 [Methanobrevibacter sp.]|nr:hypothetical protein [Methanobrevibacter sp.]